MQTRFTKPEKYKKWNGLTDTEKHCMFTAASISPRNMAAVFSVLNRKTSFGVVSMNFH